MRPPDEARETLSRAELVLLVAEAQQRALASPEAQRLVADTVKATLESIGMDVRNLPECQRDLQFLRSWRRGTEEVTHKGLLALITLVVGGAVTLFCLGFREWARR